MVHLTTHALLLRLALTLVGGYFVSKETLGSPTFTTTIFNCMPHSLTPRVLKDPTDLWFFKCCFP